VAELALAKK
jgi:colicin import membrane protein